MSEQSEHFNTALDALREPAPRNSEKEPFRTIGRGERETEPETQRVELDVLPNSHFSQAHVLRRIINPVEDA